MNGQVKNHSNKVLWVVETDSGKAVAHRLAPKRKSPPSVDADGFRAVDGTPVDGHKSWVKIIDWSTADVKSKGGKLTRGCYLCRNVGELEFVTVEYSDAGGWGLPL